MGAASSEKAAYLYNQKFLVRCEVFTTVLLMCQCVTRCVVPDVLKDCSRKNHLELIGPENEGPVFLHNGGNCIPSDSVTSQSTSILWSFLYFYCSLYFVYISWGCQLQSSRNVAHVCFHFLRIYSSLFWHWWHCIHPNTKWPWK